MTPLRMCDACGAQAVRRRLCEPLSVQNGPNNTRWRKMPCDRCRCLDDCATYHFRDADAAAFLRAASEKPGDAKE